MRGVERFRSSHSAHIRRSSVVRSLSVSCNNLFFEGLRRTARSSAAVLRRPAHSMKVSSRGTQRRGAAFWPKFCKNFGRERRRARNRGGLRARTKVLTESARRIDQAHGIVSATI